MMFFRFNIPAAVVLAVLISSLALRADEIKTFTATGVVEEVRSAEQTVVIKHSAISNYMAAMTMPFKARPASEFSTLQRGDKITFRLNVTANESWIDRISKTGTETLPAQKPQPAPAKGRTHPLLDYKFTNELGQAVSLNDFRGQALAITFFYTRCPLPDACPRLSKNFQEVSAKLKAMTNAPSNWHLLSFSFDTEFDTPAMLKAYGDSYRYDPEHWSFLTGPKDKIGALSQSCGVEYDFDQGTFNHNFRTLIVDARGHLQMVFPTGGDLSDQIVAEIIKAAAMTNVANAAN